MSLVHSTPWQAAEVVLNSRLYVKPDIFPWLLKKLGCDQLLEND